MKTRILALGTVLLTLVTATPASSAPASQQFTETIQVSGLAPDLTGLAISNSGELFLSHPIGVQKITFAPDGSATLSLVHTPGIDSPDGIAVDESDNLYIADGTKIKKLTFTYTPGPTITATILDLPDFTSLEGIAIDNDGNLFVDDAGTVKKVSSDGGVLSVSTIAIGEAWIPGGIAIDDEGDLYLGDHNFPILKVSFDQSGNPDISHIPQHHAGVLTGIDVDADGNVWVIDAGEIKKIGLDTAHPTATVLTSTTSQLGKTKTVNFTCADTGGSELATCTATLDGQPVNNGDALNTSKRGIQTLVVTAVDGVGNTTTETVTITVHGKRELTGAYKNATGTNASVARLYMATFKRAPEGDGFDFWVTAHNNGKTLQSMADYFVAGKEFGIIYGNTTNAEFVDLMYQNVMGRTPGTDATTFWFNELDTGNRTRAQMLLWFSESKEFKILTYTS